MFEKVLSKNALNAIAVLAPELKAFYLAGGTGLALQIGHRKSADLDFFSESVFDAERFRDEMPACRVSLVRKGTLHCEVDNVKMSFLYYKQPLMYPAVSWNGLEIADWRDITAEKFKTIAQRGSKKDFYDLYAVLKLKLSLKAACGIFKARFGSAGISMYHVLRGLTYFDDAESESSPKLLMRGKDWEWKSVKAFFTGNIKAFERNLV
ncbi:MAG: nucleotidyl transferase AbiEii/AbiGii toxin family protein [Planctomycetes bacterium]|nr:nucleotidyl transferase AbiEii/AbiGii toxin family protein [Planctomycetota bacterium]